MFSHHIFLLIQEKLLLQLTNYILRGSLHFFLYNRLLTNALSFHGYLSILQILNYSSLSFVVNFHLCKADYITVSWKYWVTQEILHVGIPRLQVWQSHFCITDLSNKRWSQKKNASFLILIIPCTAAIFSLLCSDLKFAS